jgi:hypothetical protein
MRLAAMKPSGYAARLGRNGKKAEWSYGLDPSNSEERCTGGGNGFGAEERNDQLVLALITCENLSSLSPTRIYIMEGRVSQDEVATRRHVLITLVTDTIHPATHLLHIS